MFGQDIQNSARGLTPEAWATLVAAFIGAAVALIVVIVQRALDQRDRKRELCRKKRVVSRALIFEIDGFYRHHLKDLSQWLTDFAARQDELPPTAIKSTEFDPFPVYHSNANVLGEFGEETVPSIVRFYAGASSYASLLREYRTVLNEKYISASRVQADALAGKLFGELKDRLPNVIALACDACIALRREVGADLRAGEIALLDGKAVN